MVHSNWKEEAELRAGLFSMFLNLKININRAMLNFEMLYIV